MRPERIRRVVGRSASSRRLQSLPHLQRIAAEEIANVHFAFAGWLDFQQLQRAQPTGDSCCPCIGLQDRSWRAPGAIRGARSARVPAATARFPRARPERMTARPRLEGANLIVDLGRRTTPVHDAVGLLQSRCADHLAAVLSLSQWTMAIPAGQLLHGRLYDAGRRSPPTVPPADGVLRGVDRRPSLGSRMGRRPVEASCGSRSHR